MSARPDTWMPVYWGDYARDTGHLNAAGHGAYLMLIKHYWCTGAPIIDDDDELWRVACCDSKKEWLVLKPKVLRFFERQDGVLRHKRIDKEIASATAAVSAKSKAGKKGAETRWQKDGGAVAEPPKPDGKIIADACGSHTFANAPSPSPSPEETSPLRSDVSGAKRAARLSEDWSPRAEEVSVAETEGVDWQRELLKFRDHWRAASGQNSRKLDWNAAFRNWLRNAPKGSARRAIERADPWANLFPDEPAPSYDLEMTADEHGGYRVQ
jgi:uncharacterized protein YdaU (DUF1376 family)